MWRNVVFLGGIIIGVICMAFVVIRTRADVVEGMAHRWSYEQGIRQLHAINDANPGLLMPDPLAVLDSGEVKMLPKLAGAAFGRTLIRVEWPHDNVHVLLERERAISETRTQFVDGVVGDYGSLAAAFEPREGK